MKLKTQIHLSTTIIASAILFTGLAVLYYILHVNIINNGYKLINEDTQKTVLIIEKTTGSYFEILKSVSLAVSGKNDFFKISSFGQYSPKPEFNTSGLYAGFNDGTISYKNNLTKWIRSDPSEMIWYKESYSRGRSVLTDAYTNPGMNRLIISASVPLYDRNNKIFGVISRDIEVINAFDDRSMHFEARNPGYILLDSNGVILKHSNASIIGKNISEFPYLNEIVNLIKNSQLSEKIILKKSGKGKNIYSWDYINENKWLLLLETDYSTVSSQLNKLSAGILSLLLVFSIIIWIISGSLSDRISWPISEITEILNKVKMNSISRISFPDLRVKSRIDEVNTLYNSFNDMILRISSSITRHNEIENKYKNLIENSPDLIYFLDVNMVFKSANKRMQNALKLPEKKIIGKNFSNFRLPETTLAILEMLHLQVIEKKRMIIEEIYDIEMVSGIFSFSIILAPQFTEGEVTGIIGTARDITKLKKYENEVNYLAYYDSVTQLPNINSLRLKLPGFLLRSDGSSEKLAAIAIKIDNFKQINDTLGFNAGDLLLNDLSVSLSILTSKTNFLARTGGDEFTILYFLKKNERIEKFLDKIMEIFHYSKKIGQYELSTSASMGVAIYPDDAEDPEEFIKNTGSALASAKNVSGNSYQLFNESIRNELLSTFILQNKLKKALTNSEISLNFQPIVSMKDCKTFAFEVLARWITSENENIPPDIFIPMAEKTGEIYKIGNYILQKACETILSWNTELKTEIFICVNVSPIQLNHPSFVNDVKNIIETSGIKPEWLELELTEGIFIKSFDNAFEIMMTLKNLGIRLALDDFGTGYSSLSYLNKLPFDTIKIDKSFINNINPSAENFLVVESLINLIHKMGFKIITEGIETEKQYKLLSEFSCDYIQGFLISRPLPEEKVFPFLKINLNSGN
ncbi:MAG: EAL domain-containing protein [Spirochaetes bacterium]|nr:EAL domain-containing protein [Spirochaetota bacterium]